MTDHRSTPSRVRDPALRLAAERTLLAWIRTGLAMMGFGFVVARFALWLRTIALATAPAPPPTHHLSIWFGTALVLIGVATNLLAAHRHRRYLRALDAGDADPSLEPTFATTIAMLLAALGLAMAAYLAIELL
jgi:putative membrane protein